MAIVPFNEAIAPPDPADILRREAWDRGVRPGVHTALCEREANWRPHKPYCSSCGTKLQNLWPFEWLRFVLWFHFGIGFYDKWWWRWGGF